MGFIRRLGEGSTWAGLGVLAQMAANLMPQYAVIFHSLTAAAVAVAGAIPDKGATK